MKTQKRQKLCLNCNGSVDLDVLVCPFCGHDLLSEKKNLEESLYQAPSQKMTPGQTIASLYPPAYRPEEMSQEEAQHSYENERKFVHNPTSMKDPFQETLNELPPEKEPSTILPVLIFSLGSLLFAMGLFIFFFSTNGIVLLKWNAKYWFLYVLMAAPLMIWGYNLLNRLDEPEVREDEEEELLEDQ